MDELVVILGNLAHLGRAQQIVAGVHFDAERVQRIDHLVRIGDDRVVLARHLGQKMALELRVERQLDLLRIDQHELQLRRMLFVEQRRDDRVQADRLALSGRPGYEQVRHLGQIDHERLVLNRLAQHDRNVVLRLLKLHRLDNRVHRHDLLVLVRHLDADRPLARYRSDDPDTEGRQAQRDVVLQILDLGNAHARRRHDLVQRHGRADRRLDFLDADAEVLERLLDPVLVLDDLLARHADLDAVVLEQLDRRALVRRQIERRIVQRALDLVRRERLVLRQALDCHIVALFDRRVARYAGHETVVLRNGSPRLRHADCDPAFRGSRNGRRLGRSRFLSDRTARRL